MDPLLAFLLTLALITFVSLRWRISPFFTLIGGAILFGLMGGLTPDETFQGIIAGVGKVFSAFGIIILCGAVIARLLQEQHQTEEIVSDIRRRVRKPPLIAGLSGYLLAVPITCCITAYILLHPILDHLEKDPAGRNRLLYLAATGSIISYALVYPTPVVIPLLAAFPAGMSPIIYDAVSIPLSLLVLAVIILFMHFLHGGIITREEGSGLPDPARGGEDPRTIHWRAWAPFIAIIGSVPVGLFLFHLSAGSMVTMIMLAGAAVALLLASPPARLEGLSRGAKHAGTVIFDICGAGALGSVIVKSGFALTVLDRMGGIIPVILIPFLFAALIETAQGSRVVTAVISADVLAGSAVAGAIHPLPFILLISGGSCFVSYVTDPYFWLVQRTTADDIRTVVRNYTLPVAAAGLILLALAVFLEYGIFR